MAKSIVSLREALSLLDLLLADSVEPTEARAAAGAAAGAEAEEEFLTSSINSSNDLRALRFREASAGYSADAGSSGITAISESSGGTIAPKLALAHCISSALASTSSRVSRCARSAAMSMASLDATGMKWDNSCLMIQSEIIFSIPKVSLSGHLISSLLKRTAMRLFPPTLQIGRAAAVCIGVNLFCFNPD